MWTYPCLGELFFVVKCIHSPLRISCHTQRKYKSGSKVPNFPENGPFIARGQMSLKSWTKNTGKKCHRLWDKLLQWDEVSHHDKLSKFSRSECHNVRWTDNPSTLRRNVTLVNCHIRRFVTWTLWLGWKVAWSVRGGQIVKAPFLLGSSTVEDMF